MSSSAATSSMPLSAASSNSRCARPAARELGWAAITRFAATRNGYIANHTPARDVPCATVHTAVTPAARAPPPTTPAATRARCGGPDVPGREQAGHPGEHEDVQHVLLHEDRGHPGGAGEGPGRHQPAPGRRAQRPDGSGDPDGDERSREQLTVDLRRAGERADQEGRGHDRRPGGRARSGQPASRPADREHADDRGDDPEQPQRHRPAEHGRQPEHGDQQGGPVHPVAAVQRGPAGVPLLPDGEVAGLVVAQPPGDERQPGEDHGQGGDRHPER